MNKILYFNCGYDSLPDYMTSFGFAFFENGKLVFETEEYFENPIDIFGTGFSYEPALVELWQVHGSYFEDADLWACWRSGNHKSILTKSLNNAGISFKEKPCIDVCNLVMSKMPGMGAYNRDFVAETLGIKGVEMYITEIDKVRFCCNVVNKVFEDGQDSDIFGYYNRMQKKKRDSAKAFFGNSGSSSVGDNLEYIAVSLEGIVGKAALVTGVFNKYPERVKLEKVLSDHGMVIMKGLNSKLDYIIVGLNPGPRKIEFGIQLSRKKDFGFINGDYLEGLIGEG
jgi:hypothetical protein